MASRSDVVEIPAAACRRKAKRDSMARKRKTFNPYYSSYGIKHAAQEWAGRYISNGVLIAAAIQMGFKVIRIYGIPNAEIGIARFFEVAEGCQPMMEAHKLHYGIFAPAQRLDAPVNKLFFVLLISR